MKSSLLFSILFIGFQAILFAQKSPSWSVPHYEVKYSDDKGEVASLKIDQGFQYADLDQDGKPIHIFFKRNQPLVKHARIVNQSSGEQIARGKGGFFLNNARMEFADGTIINLRKKRNPNGYEIIGPYGTLFKVENFGIVSVSTLTQKDFLTQAFFVFNQIRATQKPPIEILYLQNTATIAR